MTDFQFLILPDGRQLSYVEFGNKDGYPVLYFHGTPSSCLEPSTIGDDVFIKHHLRVISPSRPGMGQSDEHKNRTFIDWTADTIALADHLGIEQFAILGYSGGAPYTLACTLKIPKQASLSCDRLRCRANEPGGSKKQPGFKAPYFLEGGRQISFLIAYHAKQDETIHGRCRTKKFSCVQKEYAQS